MKRAFPILRVGLIEESIDDRAKLRGMLVGIRQGTIRIAGRTAEGLPIYEATLKGMSNKHVFSWERSH